MNRFGRRPLPLDQRLPVDALLDDAFAPLRARSAPVGAARVRAAVRWAAPAATPLRGMALVTRISEISVAAAVSAFLFAGAATSVSAMPAVPDLSRNAVSAGEWTLNGRNALQRPMDSRATDYRITAGEAAANAATTRRVEPAPWPTVVRDTEPFAHRP
jgi:hypothetical protein